MACVEPELNLLFGLLALQNGLIDQAALIGAFRVWTRDKSRPLGGHLVERGDLDLADRGAVDAMVDCYLKRHGGDAEKSLSALPFGGGVREEPGTILEPDTVARLERILNVSLLTQEVGDLDSTTTLAVEPARAGRSRFAYLRPHAEGGLGRVGVALDSELHREVALKEILPRLADDPQARRRFLREAELTGRLEHPGVVPVYGLGADGQGRPYYAMRLIRGDSLKQALNRFHAAERVPGRDPTERALALRGLLGRFVSVCQALAYAHSRGVIHRDVKPANIMLGPYGETLVVDWGLAKVIGRDDPIASAEGTLRPSGDSGTSETQAGSAIGTPAYMSPEQADGRLDAIGPASDVYSLGATLYCLLTGKPPISGGNLAEVLQAVQRGEFPAPRAANPGVAAGLEAVILKAMALRPNDRYSSAAALAGDVEHWLAGEPVAAYPEPAITRLARWGRRHRTAVVGVVTLLVAAVVALSAGTLLLGRANATAQSERDRAVKNFQMARQAVDDYLTQVGQSAILKDQGLHELRQDLLRAALRYYEDFLAQHGDDSDLRREAAEAHGRVGVIANEMGNPKDALIADDKGLALLASIDRERPGDPEVAIARVRLLAHRLHALRDGGRLQEADSSVDAVAADEGRLLLGHQDGDQMYAALAEYFFEASKIGREAGRSDGGIPTALRAVVLGEARIGAHADDLDAAKTLISSYSIATQNLLFAGRLDDASAYGLRATDIAEAQALTHPTDIELLMIQASLSHTLSNVAKTRGRNAEASDLLKRSLQVIERIRNGHPSLIRPRMTQANHLILLSQIQSDLGQLDEAEVSARQVITLGEALARDVPTSLYFRTTIGYGQAALGKVLMRKPENLSEAIRSLRQAVEFLEATDDGTDLMNAACSLSLISTIDDPSEGVDGVARRNRDADQAIATLGRAFEKGYADFNSLRTDPDFTPVRSREDFQALLREMEAKSKADPRSL